MKRTLTLFLYFLTPILLWGQIYNDYIGAGHNEGVIITSSSQQSESNRTISGAGLVNDLAGASRFMSHATLGADLEDLLYVDALGYEAWLDEQMNLPVSSYEDALEPIDDIAYDIYLELGGDPAEYYTSWQAFRFAWSHVIHTTPDVLRHKVALALSEILVVSSDSDLLLRGFGLASYYDVLARHAFGNFEDLLMDVTLHPMMGFYLTYFNNPRSGLEENVHPDENYAREIMQLFTIGLYELNQDGSRIIDDEGRFIPTYDNDDIKELAKIFTGLGMTDWGFEDINLDPGFGYPFFLTDATLPMTMYEAFHEPGPKNLIGGFTVPAGQTGIEDVEMTINHLFNHPNVGPFICTRLIQHLVKSNPTPSYVERVANVFADNGNGVRGDLMAVVKAILLDEEARDCFWIYHPSNGKLKEPIQRHTQYTRGLRAETPNGWFWNQGFVYEALTGQFPMHAPSVFNFFLPDYEPNSAFADQNMVAPEFQIFNSTTSIGYFNYMYYMTLLDFNNEIPQESLDELGLVEQYTAVLNIPDLEAIANNPEAVVDYLDLVLAQGNMSQETRDAIIASSAPLVDNPEFLLKMALYLTMVSPDFAVMK